MRFEGKLTRTCKEINNKLFLDPPLGLDHVLFDYHAFFYHGYCYCNKDTYNNESTLLDQEQGYWIDPILWYTMRYGFITCYAISFIPLCYNYCDSRIWDPMEIKLTRTCKEINNKLFLVPPLGLDHVLFDDHAFLIMGFVIATRIRTIMKVHVRITRVLKWSNSMIYYEIWFHHALLVSSPSCYIMYKSLDHENIKCPYSIVCTLLIIKHYQ
jgi:hypothetical protein